MNYYHTFVPGFNFWYILAAAGLMAAFGYGWTRPRAKGPMKHPSEKARALSRYANVIFALLVYVESGQGLTQLLYNTIGSVDPSTLPIQAFLVISIVVTTAIYDGLLRIMFGVGIACRKRALVHYHR